MKYREVLSALYDETETTAIFAINSYGDGKLGMGFRRECVGSSLKDPCIDEIPFMLCADAWNCLLDCAITRTDDLLCTPQENIEIRLRAVAGCFPFATVELGRFEVVGMCTEESEVCYFLSGPRKIPSRVRLDIKRYDY